MWYASQNQFDQAAPLHERALEIRRKVFGERHPVVAQSLENLAAAYTGLERRAEAVELLKQSAEIWEEHVGAEHEMVAECCYSMGSILYEDQKYNEAEEQLQRARRIMAKKFGASHPNLGAIYNALAAVCEKLGHEMEAREYTVRFANIYKEFLKQQSGRAPDGGKSPKNGDPDGKTPSGKRE